MKYTSEELEKHKLVDNYINFYRLVEEYDLDEGGLSPEQYMQLQSILIEFVLQNKWEKEEESKLPGMYIDEEEENTYFTD